MSQAYDELFPRDEGPFRIENYTAKIVLDQLEPEITVHLDWGAFRRLWEILESEARRHYPTHETMSTARAELRAVKSFRSAYRHHQEITGTLPKRKLQRPSNGKSEAPAAKRKLVRRGS